MVKDKLDELLNLRKKIDGTTLEEVVKSTLILGLVTYHPYFERYLNGTYKNIKYNPQTKTISLTGEDNSVQALSEKELKKWQEPRGYTYRKKK